MIAIAKTALAACLAASLALPAAAQVAPEAGWLAAETAKGYRALARYPEHSRALAPGEIDPLRAKRAPSKHSLPGPQGADPLLTMWASAVSYEQGAPVDLFASLGRSGDPLPSRDTEAVEAEVVTADGAPLARVAYQDDGQAPDARAGDGIWSARLLPPVDLEPGVAESFLVKVRARGPAGVVREAAGGFLYGNPAARLTGRYRDLVQDGDLVIAAEVEVLAAGRFHLAGTLYTQGGEPLGTAQAAAELAPGRRWLLLSFYGLMFHDRQAAGRFRLGSLALATTSRMPNVLNDLVVDAHTTRPYRREQMKAAPFGERRLLDAAARLEREAARSREQP